MDAVDPRGAVRPEPSGLRLRVRLTPKSARDAIGRLERLGDGNEVLIVHVRALPADGAANAALARLLADILGVAKTKVEVVAGHTSRVKTVKITGAPTDLAAALTTAIAAAT
jgi:uncharacterized protein (TIGR00251 family)